MKNILPWLKKNWIVPTLCVFIFAVLGGTWWFSSAWNASIREEQQQKAGKLLGDVNNLKVTYALPLVAGQDKAVEMSVPPNSFYTQKFAERKKQLLEQRESVVKLAEAFNKGDKKALIEGLFPSPAAGQEQSKVLDFVQKLAGNPAQGTQSAYQGLLDSVRAGGPVNSSQLEAQLNDILRRETEKIKGNSANRELTQTEKESLSKLLLDARKAEYVRRANEVSVYADMSVFPSSASSGPGGFPGGASSGGSNQILLSAPATPPGIRQTFLWQADYWLLQDIFSIVRAANSSDGKLASERDAVVKRIEKIELLPWHVQTASESAAGAGNAGAPAASGEFRDSISGHADGASSEYDVRRARVTLIVSSARLPELFNAIGRTNFAFVVGFAMDRVDGWQDLSQGYYYGDENVVRVLLDLEFTWLRSWTEPLFPPTVRTALGLPDLPVPGSEGHKPDEGPK